MAPPGLPTLPLRADVLLSATIFDEIDDGISEEFLRHHTGKDDLLDVDFIELQVDAVGASQRVECLGEMMPNLKQLRLNQSHICTVRDLGINLQHLRVLWLCRCSLQDLGGISALPVLEELYVSFNDIFDLSPLCTHEALQILDLEGNLIEDFDELVGLQAVDTLRELNISLNPVRKADGVTRNRIFQALPQLEILDDLPLGVEEAAIDENAVLADDFLGELESIRNDPRPDMFYDEELSDVSDDEQKGLRSFLEEEADTSHVTGFVHSSLVEDDVATSDAVAAFRTSAAKALAESPSASKRKDEPTEQDLVVESLKRHERPPSSLWTYREGSTARSMLSTSREEVKCRPTTGFFPTSRCGLRSAWGYGASSSASTSLGRPATAASSCVSSGRSIGHLSGIPAEFHVFDDAASELTAGDGGASLAGNALVAIRRRRKVAAARGEDELDIRDLLRRFEAGVEQKPVEVIADSCPEPRPATADVRITPGRPLTGATIGGTAGRRATASGHRGADTSIDVVLSPQKCPRPKVRGAAEILVVS